jgi:TctA family transporter
VSSVPPRLLCRRGSAVDVLAVGLLSCFVEGVVRKSPVVLLAVSVLAVGFEVGGVSS